VTAEDVYAWDTRAAVEVLGELLANFGLRGAIRLA
jgi:hypothetical protein